MLNCRLFYDALGKNNISFFTGVPDSLLKNFCAYVMDTAESQKHLITANEGNAVAIATGYYLATGNPGLVYMQNSGLGNAINPLTSLSDPSVYGIPMLLLIGWRGEPGKIDEPQHEKQGKITLPLLESMGIPYNILSEEQEQVDESLVLASKVMREKSTPYALVVRKGTFKSYKLRNEKVSGYEMTREDSIRIFADSMLPEDVVVSTTGKCSRELYEYLDLRDDESLKQVFLTVGSMGHTSQIALGIAESKPDKQIFCLDGDGSLIMHMGSLAIIGSRGLSNYYHIVINNGAHDSVGGQPTVAFDIDFIKVAQACGYKTVLKAETKEELIERLQSLRSSGGPSFLEIRTNKGARQNLGRPTLSPIENKNRFMKFLLK